MWMPRKGLPKPIVIRSSRDAARSSKAGNPNRSVERRVVAGAVIVGFLVLVRERGEGHRGRWRSGHDLRPGVDVPVGCDGPAHLDAGPVLLHHGLHDELLPDALRVQP